MSLREMQTTRISASSYSNTAPLIWSFLYGRGRGSAEVILDTAPARSAQLLAEDRVDAALVPVIAYQSIPDVRLVPDVCVGARERVRSVCIATRGRELEDVRSISLDTSSRTSAALTRIIFREFIGREPEWREAEPDVEKMLSVSDAALLIGDPALRIPDGEAAGIRKFDLAALWRQHTGLGFVFAMWMTRRGKVPLDLAGARDEGLAHMEEIISNYESDIELGRDEMRRYLAENISYSVHEDMQAGMELYFKLAQRHGIVAENRPLVFI